MASAAFSVLLCLSFSASNAQVTLDPTQTYTTNNVVVNTTTSSGSTWNNAIYQDNLTCWGWGDPGYCGPNPIVRPGGNINFSFGLTNIYQLQVVASILPELNTPLRVNGYNFGFTAKNGNGWDDSRMDTLSAYVKFNDAAGTETYSKMYDLNSRFNWTTFNYSETFNTPYASKDLSTVQYGFIGRDNNFWAGPYGPEIYGVNFSLKYSVDTCAIDPLSSTSCPGYSTALAKIVPTSAVSTVSTAEPVTTTGETKVDVGGVEMSTSGTLVVPDGIPQTVKDSNTQVQAATANNLQVSTNTSIGADAKKDDPKARELALNVVKQVQAADKATQNMAVQTALTSAQEANTFSLNVVTQSQEQATQQQAQIQQQQQQSVQVVSGTGLQPPQAQQVQQTSQFTLNMYKPQTSFGYSINPSTVQQSTLTQTTAVQPASFILVKPESKTQEVPQITTMPSIGFQLRGNPLADAMEQKPFIEASNTATQQTSSVNKSVQPNELAAGVDLNRLSTTPQGYTAYTSLTLKDVAFYAPREVYRNQQVVDNVRVLRGLGSDQKHEEMVRAQYK